MQLRSGPRSLSLTLCGWLAVVACGDDSPQPEENMAATNLTASPLGLTAYRDANFAGASQLFEPGVYVASLGQLSVVGDNAISSLNRPRRNERARM